MVGGSVYADRLENDREFGQKELQASGVTVLSSWNFTNFDEAIEFVSKNPDRYVIKPSGAAQNEKELLLVGKEFCSYSDTLTAHFLLNYFHKKQIPQKNLDQEWSSFINQYAASRKTLERQKIE